MTALSLPLLWTTILLPLVGAGVVSCIRQSESARRWCIVFSAAALAASLWMWREFAALGVAAARDRWDILGEWLGGELWVVDDLSAPLIPLTALVYLLTAVATQRSKMRRFSFAAVLLLEALTLATVCTRSPWPLVALLSLATLPPLWELRARRKPLGVYLWHMGLFVVCLAAGWGWIEWQGGIGQRHSLWTMLPLLLAIMVRSGVAPFHCWITDLFEHATLGTSLVYIAPLAGAYAAVRLVLPIASDDVLHALSFLAAATAVYAAGMALVQKEARRFFCYVLLSHAALVLVGLESGGRSESAGALLGLTGALCVWLSMALSLVGFGLTLRALEARHGRLSLAGYHGVYEHTPLLAICFLLTGMASVGFPGTIGFLGMELLVDGVVQSHPYLGVAVVLAAALNGIAVVQAYFRLFTGTRHVSSVPLHVTGRERLVVLTLAVLILGGGLYPQAEVASRHEAAEQILSQRASHAATPLASAHRTSIPTADEIPLRSD